VTKLVDEKSDLIQQMKYFNLKKAKDEEILKKVICMFLWVFFVGQKQIRQK
jgi:hypothetical protein